MARFRNVVPVAALMAYLSSLMVGGMHHHEHREASAIHHSDSYRFQLAAATIQSSLSIISIHDDADGCTLCIALHQAKAQPAAISPMIGIALVGEASGLPVESPIASIPVIHQARAPPFMS